MRWLAVLLTVAPLVSAGSAVAAENTDLAIAEWFGNQSLALPSPRSIVICHGFGCRFRKSVALGDGDRARFAQMLQSATPEGERRGIARAVAWFDQRFARITGTGHAKARAGGAAGDASQFDCIDRTANTMSLIAVLGQWGLLRHHKLIGPSSRNFVLAHTTAVVAERVGGKKWVVDPWTHNSGELPDVMPLEVWVKRS